jgi:hypothetical protein
MLLVLAIVSRLLMFPDVQICAQTLQMATEKITLKGIKSSEKLLANDNRLCLNF